ncbi:hypothetical protein [Sorangium sp. So ce426]|uniref:hypothetical protein n=1 Tax=Sorangium sp. So ce426 TaxID=3133312 RepID=UPI003F5C2371
MVRPILVCMCHLHETRSVARGLALRGGMPARVTWRAAAGAVDRPAAPLERRPLARLGPLDPVQFEQA